MQLNVLNDLAEAMKALDGKKIVAATTSKKVALKFDGQTFDPLASCEDIFVWKFGGTVYWTTLNLLEPTWTSLNVSWNNVCRWTDRKPF